MNRDALRTYERLSHIDVYGLGRDRTKWENSLDQFAELIIRECARIAGGVDGQIILNYLGVDNKQVVSRLSVAPEIREQ